MALDLYWIQQQMRERIAQLDHLHRPGPVPPGVLNESDYVVAQDDLFFEREVLIRTLDFIEENYA